MFRTSSAKLDCSKSQIDTQVVGSLDFLQRTYYKCSMFPTFKHPVFVSEPPRHSRFDRYGGGWQDGSGNGTIGSDGQGCYGFGDVEGDGVGLGEGYGDCSDDYNSSGFGDRHGFGNGDGSGTGFDNDAGDTSSVAARLAWMEE